MKRKRRQSTIRGDIRRVLSLEARAIESVRGAIGPAYERAVRAMARCRGKIILIGMGKSGLVAQKIAATMASTGTPAIYLHPSEALHGSLGMIQKQDIVLALGKSGETPEVNALFPALNKMGVKIIAITSNPKSTMSRNSHIVLNVPIDREACPLNLAPTSSTTATLAIGDALAVALMTLNGFDRDKFADYHPAGQLGKRLTLRVSDVMRSGKENPVVRATASAQRMLVELTRKHAGAINVVDARGRFKGLIADYDIRRALERGSDIRNMALTSIMNTNPTTVAPETLAAQASDIMRNRSHPLSVLPVVDGSRRAVGILINHDLRAHGL